MKTHRVSRNLLLKLTGAFQERNIYIHPNPVARDIFWQRLEKIENQMRRIYREEIAGKTALDFGGGSGVFAKALSALFQKIDIVDLDTSAAENIKRHFDLGNVRIMRKDVRELPGTEKYDAVIAADVLEHFKDLHTPVGIIKKLLRQNGFLFTSLPTENALYRIARRIVKKTKPLDHYHASRDVIDFLRKEGFRQITNAYVPRYGGIAIPLFEISAWELKGYPS